jgi:hypothetical protein
MLKEISGEEQILFGERGMCAVIHRKGRWFL